MPVKRRSQKRRVDPRAEVEAWAMVFQAGYDFFGELRDFGVGLSEHGVPDRSATADAWARLGHLFMESEHADPQRECWAAREFGEPDAR